GFIEQPRRCLPCDGPHEVRCGEPGTGRKASGIAPDSPQSGQGYGGRARTCRCGPCVRSGSEASSEGPGSGRGPQAPGGPNQVPSESAERDGEIAEEGHSDGPPKDDTVYRGTAFIDPRISRSRKPHYKSFYRSSDANP